MSAPIVLEQMKVAPIKIWHTPVGSRPVYFFDAGNAIDTRYIKVDPSLLIFHSYDELIAASHLETRPSASIARASRKAASSIARLLREAAHKCGWRRC